MNNKFTSQIKALLPPFVSMCFFFILTIGQIKAATTFSTDTTWRVTSTNFSNWTTIPYVLNSSWIVPGPGNTNCGVVQTGVAGAAKIWYPATNSLRTCYFRKNFSIGQLCEVKSVTVEIASADSYTLYVNGVAIASGNASAKVVSIPLQILQCENVIAIQARDTDAKCWWMAAKVNINTSPFTFTSSSNSAVANPICVGQTLNLTATSLAGANYVWSGPNGFVATQQNPNLPIASVNASGVYTVSASVGKCCKYSATVSVKIKDCMECLDIIQKEIVCKNGVYYETFCIKNNSTHTATNINLISTTPSITYSPNILSPSGGLAPGQTYCTTVVVGGSGATTNSTVCFNAMLFEIKQCQQTWFCVSKDVLCVKLPLCNVQTSCDSVKVSLTPNTINLCLGDSVQLNPVVSPWFGLNYLWSPATGLSSSTIRNPTVKPLVTTTYNLTVSVPNTTCKKNASVTVVVKQCPPVPCQWAVSVRDSVLTICKGSSISLVSKITPMDSSATITWTSSPASLIMGGNFPAVSVMPTVSPTVYSVNYSLVNANGAVCKKSATTKVFIKDCPPPCLIKVSVKDSVLRVCPDVQTTLSALSNVSGAVYSWSPMTGIISGGNTANVTVSPSFTTTYTVTAKDTINQGCIASATVRIELIVCNSINPNSSRMTTEPDVSDEITIAPNPTQSFISVQIPDSFNWKSATLIDAKGVILNELQRIENANTAKFELQSQPSGIYIISVKTDKGFVNKKVIKE